MVDLMESLTAFSLSNPEPDSGVAYVSQNPFESPDLASISDKEPHSASDEEPEFKCKDLVTLNVGGRRFVTSRSTLTRESPYFAALLAERWGDGAERDGSYFIDQDGDDFPHILRYLRNKTLPIFYDRAKGHDLEKYQAVLGLARYFLITRLMEWVGKQQYLKAVKNIVGVTEYSELYKFPTHYPSNVDVQVHPRDATEKWYVCPRKVEDHRSKTVRGMRCGAACRRLMSETGPELEEIIVRKYLVVATETRFVGGEA
jgi:BTB/POZ domain